MKKNKLILFSLLYLFGYGLSAKDSNIYDLEKRVALLEKQVSDLKKKSKNQIIETEWRKLKKGLSKIKVKKDFGTPDRVGKYLNGDEIWGFRRFTLKFDNKGNLKEWSRPFSE